MGLLDALFSGDTYSGQGGGILDLIRNSQQQNDIQQNAPGFQPSFPPRSFDNTQFDPRTFAPNQAQPIGVGGYQMPRIGSEDQFTPVPGAQPGPAMNANAQATPQQAQPEQLPPALGGNQFGGNIGAGFQNLVNSKGLLPALSGGLTGLLTGQRTDPAGMAQQNQAAVYHATRQALIDNGDDERTASSKAMVAALNPEAAKTILPELFTNKQKYGVISEDPLAGKKYGFINERDQTVNGKPVGASDSAGGSMDDLQKAQAAGVSGSALYDYLPKAMAPTVKAMIEGRQPLPSTTAMRSPATLALIDAAHSIDPTFDATTWKSRNEAGPDWTKGKSSEMVRAANQTLAHVGSLMDAMDNLNNGRVPAFNSIGNTFNEQVLGKGEPGAFRTNAHAVAEEMSKVFKGANLSDSEIRHWEQNLSENMSPAQQKAQIGKLSELLHGSLQALEEKRLTAMGPAQAEKQGPLIKEEGQKVLKRIDGWLAGNSTPSVQEGATATNPKTGQKITFINGKWQ